MAHLTRWNGGRMRELLKNISKRDDKYLNHCRQVIRAIRFYGGLCNAVA